EAWRARLHAVVPSMAYLDSAVRCHRWQQAAAGKHGSVIVTAARTRPEKPVQPFTHWSLRKLAGYLAGLGRPVRIGRERLRQLLHERGISFQRTRTWKESADPDRDANLAPLDHV